MPNDASHIQLLVDRFRTARGRERSAGVASLLAPIEPQSVKNDIQLTDAQIATSCIGRWERFKSLCNNREHHFEKAITLDCAKWAFIGQVIIDGICKLTIPIIMKSFNGASKHANRVSKKKKYPIFTPFGRLLWGGVAMSANIGCVVALITHFTVWNGRFSLWIVPVATSTIPTLFSKALGVKSSQAFVSGLTLGIWSSAAIWAYSLFNDQTVDESYQMFKSSYQEDLRHEKINVMLIVNERLMKWKYTCHEVLNPLVLTQMKYLIAAYEMASKVARNENRSGVIDFAILPACLPFAKKYLYVSTKDKAIFYLAAVALLSVVASCISLPDIYFAQKNNVLNVYFVKIGWFWTCFVLTPFVWYISDARGDHPFDVALHMSRIMIATGFWYICTNSFVALEEVTSQCNGSSATTKSACKADGGTWIPGFDISGHCFLLIYSILVLCEESSALKSISLSFGQRPSDHQNDCLLGISLLSICTLHLLWDFELLISVLYYHHIYHKILGSFFAIICWYISYRVWYRKVGLPSTPLKSSD